MVTVAEEYMSLTLYVPGMTDEQLSYGVATGTAGSTVDGASAALMMI